MPKPPARPAILEAVGAAALTTSGRLVASLVIKYIDNGLYMVPAAIDGAKDDIKFKPPSAAPKPKVLADIRRPAVPLSGMVLPNTSVAACDSGMKMPLPVAVPLRPAIVSVADLN